MGVLAHWLGTKAFLVGGGGRSLFLLLFIAGVGLLSLERPTKARRLELLLLSCIAGIMSSSWGLTHVGLLKEVSPVPLADLVALQFKLAAPVFVFSLAASFILHRLKGKRAEA